jgi:hypothetical protein
MRAGGMRAGGMRAGGMRAGGLRAGGMRAGGMRAGGLRAGGMRAGGLRAGGLRGIDPVIGFASGLSKRLGAVQSFHFFNFFPLLPYLKKLIFILLKRMQFLFQHLHKLISRVFGANIFKSDLLEILNPANTK